MDPSSKVVQEALSVRSSLISAVMVGRDIRYILGFDYAAVDLDPADRAALNTVAVALGHAIERRALEQRTLDAERERADAASRLATLLASVVSGSRLLIDADPGEFEPALLRWLAQFAESTRAQRAAFYDWVTFEATGTSTARALCEWVRPGVQGSFPASFAAPFVIDPRGAEELLGRVANGEIGVFHASELTGPMKTYFEVQGNQTVIAVPVLTAGRPGWLLSFDFDQRHESDIAEVTCLRTAADTLAAVLRRNEAVQAMLAEREARVSAEAARADEAKRHAEVLQKDAGLIGAVARAAACLGGGGTLDERIATAVRLVGEDGGFDRTYVHPFDARQRAWFVREQFNWARPGVGSVVELTGECEFPEHDFPEVMEIHQQGKPWIASSASRHGANAELNQRTGTHEDLMLPIFVGAAYWGLVGCDNVTHSRPIRDSQVQTLTTLAAAIAAAIEREQQSEVLERDAALIGAVARAATCLGGAGGLDERIAQAVRIVGEEGGFDRTYALPFDTQTQVWSIGKGCHWARDGVRSVLDLVGQVELAATDYPEVMQAHAQGRAWSSSPSLREGANAELNQRIGTHEDVILPVLVGGAYWGSVGFDNVTHSRPIRDSQVQTLTTLAAAIAAAIEREAQSSLLARTNEALARTMSSVADLSRPVEVLAQIARVVQGLLAARMVAVCRIDAEAGRIAPTFLLDDERLVDGDAELADLGSALADFPGWARIAASDGPVVFQLPAHDDALYPRLRQLVAQAGKRWLLELPMRVEGQLRWLLGVSGDDDSPLTDANLRLVETIAHPLKLALELQRVAEEAAAAAMTRERESAEQLRLAAVLGERNRIARELHDGIAQSFLAISMQIDRMASGRDAEVRSALETTRAMARHGLQEARRAVAALRPSNLAESALPGALELLARQTAAAGSTQVELVAPPQWIALAPLVEDHLYRIVQEALNNTLKHANARHVRIEVSQTARETTVLVSDDGVGFRMSEHDGQGGFGLESMRQRARAIGAQLQVVSHPDGGTQILVAVPEPPG